jgi:hypothetical protein
LHEGDADGLANLVSSLLTNCRGSTSSRWKKLPRIADIEAELAGELGAAP